MSLPSFTQNRTFGGQLNDVSRTRSHHLFCATRNHGPTWAGTGMLGRVMHKGKLFNEAGRIDTRPGGQLLESLRDR